MKRFMDFMRRHYDQYYVVDENGQHREVDRATCFASSYDQRQRWYWDDENHTFIVCLSLTKEDVALGNAHLAALKKDERHQIIKLQ